MLKNRERGFFMRRISTKDLRELEVVNLCDGEKLGYPTDFEFDMECGQILAIIVPVCEGFLSFGKRQDIIIPWNKIECIGEDTILVKLTSGETSCYNSKKTRKR